MIPIIKIEDLSSLTWFILFKYFHKQVNYSDNHLNYSENGQYACIKDETVSTVFYYLFK